MEMKRSPLNKPSAAAHVADPVGNNRLSDRPDWGELLRSLLPPSPVSAGSSPDAGQPHPEQSPPARSAAAADRSKRSGKAVQGRTAAASHRHSVLAVLLLGEAELFAGDTPFVHQTASGKHWIAALPLDQPSNREQAAALDLALDDAIAGGAEAAARALEHRTAAAQRCNPVTLQQLADAMQHIHEGDLCPELPPADDSGAASDAPLSSGVINGPSGSSGNAAFNGASAGLALAVFMAEMVSQVEGHCAERGFALARLWNAHIAISALTAGAQREELQQLQEAHAVQEAQLRAARAEAAAVQRLRKQLASQSQAADGLRAELRAATQECDSLRQQLAQAQSDAIAARAQAATHEHAAVSAGPSRDAV